MTRWSYQIKIWLSILLATSLLAGCSPQQTTLSYPLESVTQNGPQASKVYRAANQTVPQVAQALAEKNKPQEISKEDPKQMFLVYPNELYNLQQDPKKPEDTLVEVDSKQFVQQNYNPSFLEGYLLASVIDNLFDGLRGRGSYGQYRGYTNRDVYKPQTVYRPPTSIEKKATPPITVPGSGSIFRRSDRPAPGNYRPGNQTDTGNSIFKKPTMNSPPKTRLGGSGKIRRRR